MKRKVFILTLIVLCIQHSNSAHIKKFKENIYSFNSIIATSNNASDKVIGQWSYSGELVVQHLEDLKVFKLNNLKTKLFNGLKSNEADSFEKEIPDDKMIITEPFGIYSKNLTDIGILVLPEEPLWSINMKKAIASIFHIDPSLSESFSNAEEKTLSGICAVNVEVLKTDETKKITKTFDLTNCTYGPFEWKHQEWASVNNNHVSLQLNDIKRNYVISNKNNEVTSIESSSTVIFQTSPDVRSNHQMIQLQRFKLISTSEKVEPIDTTNNTRSTDVIYEDPGNPDDENITQIEHLKNFENSYKNFKEMMHQHPLLNFDIRNYNSINNMFNDLAKLEIDSLMVLALGNMLSEDNEKNHIFLAILPYINSNHTTLFIKELVKNDAINDLLLIKLLATFPEYVDYPDEALLKDCEILLNLKKVKNEQVKHTAILSFAALVAEGVERNTISDEVADKYVEKLLDIYFKINKHENQLKYLLALINVGARIDMSTILNIFDNSDESRHIRALAMYGFKSQLIESGTEVFERIWPLVKNTTEDFEVRVAALDLLLSCEITEEQFDEIVNYYDKEHFDPYEEHLANYVFTTIYSVQNTTGYYYYLGEWATARVQKGNIPRYLRSWTTGNYRIAFTDKNSNFGSSLQTRLVADPISNAVNVIQLNFEHFAMSINFGQYHIYIKLEGVLDMMFIEAFLNSRPNDEIPIVALLELIQQHKYKFKERKDIFVEFVVFYNNRALFGMHINEQNIEKYTENPLYVDLIKLLFNYNSISFPLYNSISSITDLGTPFEVTYDMTKAELHSVENAEEFFNDEFVKNFTIKHTSYLATLLFLTSRNPFTDNDIESYKIHLDLKSLNLPLTFNTSSFKLSWENKNDTFNWVMDNLIGTTVSNLTILQEYCPTCDEYEEISVGEANSECIESEKNLTKCKMDDSIWYQDVYPILGLGVNINLTEKKESEEMENLRTLNNLYGVNQLSQIVNTHQSNTYYFPLAKPFLYYLHFIMYNTYLDNDLKSFSVRTMTLFDEPSESELQILIDENNIYNKNDPIDNNQLNASFELTQKRSKDGHILSSINGTFEIGSLVKTKDGDSTPHIEHNFELYIDVLGSNNLKKKLCINREMLYPNRRSDKLSLATVKAAKGKTTISWDTVKSFEDGCPPYFIKLTEIATATEKQNREAQETKKYKKCKNESLGLKYIPPTEACSASHKAISLYSEYSLYAEFLHGGERPSIEATDLNQLKHNKIFKYNHINDGQINVSIAKGFLRMFEIYAAKPDLLNYVETSTFADFMSADPTAIAYDDYEAILGIISTCEITSSTIKNFNGQYKSIFKDTPSKDIIAFVENFNVTRSGLVVHKVDSKTIVFKFWSGDDVVSTKIHGGKLKVMVNGKERFRTETEQDDSVKIYFLEDDVIYIVTSLTNIYYTTESISIESLSLFNNYISGECSYKNEYLES